MGIGINEKKNKINTKEPYCFLKKQTLGRPFFVI